MTRKRIKPRPSAMRRMLAAFDLHSRALVARARALQRNVNERAGGASFGLRLAMRRRAIISALAALCLVGTPLGLLWWRLSTGPLSVDIVTPWLTSALQERLGAGHQIEVGGTQLERTEEGRAALRLRDIVVRDPDGTVVATAPKAEVGLSGTSLLTGHLQAKRLSLIGATMAVRVERDGELTIFAGAEQRPIATASAPGHTNPGIAGSGGAPSSEGAPPSPAEAGMSAAAQPGNPLTTLLGWLEGLDVLGLDGHELSEIGLKNGSLAVDDLRTGKHLTFSDINLSLTRPKEGGVALAINSKGTDGPSSLTATVTPRGHGRRVVEAVLRDLSPKDLMLALRVDNASFEADMPISAILRGEIGPDGVPEVAEGRIVLGAGYIGNPTDEEDRIVIDEAHVNLRWDASTRQITMPIEVLAGANRISLLAAIEAPQERGGAWQFTANHGSIVLGSVDHGDEAPLVLDRLSLGGRIDLARHRIELTHGDLGGTAADLGFSGALDYSAPDLRLVAGLAGTRMSASSLKRIWPVFVQTKVRKWVIDNIPGGTVERLEIATNAPLATLRSGGPPVPDDGISIELISSGVLLHPIKTLPIIRDADLVLHTKGRKVTVTINHGTADFPSGRKLSVANVLFEVPDTFPRDPPARLRFRFDGGVDAVAELIGMDPLREASGLQLDPATSRGSVVATVSLGLPIMHNVTQDRLTYGIEADFANFSADHMFRNFKVEAAALHISATPQGIAVRGDTRIGGVPASIDYHVPIGGGDAEVRAQATLDDSSRGRLGMELNGALGGAIPIKVAGRVGSGDHDTRVTVEADLTQAKIVELLPGWNKPSAKSARVSFVTTYKPHVTRFEDIVVEGPGTLVKGTVELNNDDGEITLASFPTFNLSDGDKASLKSERAPDGVLKVTMRGEVYDGRGFVKGSMSNAAPTEKQKTSAPDLDLDIKLGAVAGFNGEALRSVDLKLARRAGQIRSFSLSAKLGRDATLLGDLRGQPGGRNVIKMETNDAGALCRFTDTYPRIAGGQLWVTMDPPTADQGPQEGEINVRHFAVRDEPALARFASGNPANYESGRRFSPESQDVDFSHLRMTFTRAPGKLAIRDGVVWGPSMGATLDGVLDYAHDAVRMRGTFVPLYGLNNMFVHLPLVGPILGGENEGLLGVTYEVVGPPHAPELRINPMSTLALGPLRKLFEFRGNDGALGPQQTPTRE
jgi:Protein of unknown function